MNLCKLESLDIGTTKQRTTERVYDSRQLMFMLYYTTGCSIIIFT